MTVALFAGLPLIVIQCVPGPPLHERPVIPAHSIEANLNPDPGVASILRRACMDCHSYETRWPWYSRIAPISWQVRKDVAKARKALNLSEWSVQAGRRPDTAISTLAVMCADVQAGRMPLKPYLLIHPEARLSESDRRQLCDWTQAETRRYIRLKREKQTVAVHESFTNTQQPHTAVPSTIGTNLISQEKELRDEDATTGRPGHAANAVRSDGPAGAFGGGSSGRLGGAGGWKLYEVPSGQGRELRAR